MIRDPSDGSVKGPLQPKDRATDLLGRILLPETTGLPIDKSKADEIARLQRSRNWLENYKAKKLLGEQGEAQE